MSNYYNCIRGDIITDNPAPVQEIVVAQNVLKGFEKKHAGVTREYKRGGGLFSKPTTEQWVIRPTLGELLDKNEITVEYAQQVRDAYKLLHRKVDDE